MKIDKYSKVNIMTMDSMHDSRATEIRIETNSLIIIYDGLDEEVLGPDGNPYYKSKKLTIKYDFDTHCDAMIYYGKNKVLWIDLLDNPAKFYEVTKKCLFESYKYLVDSFEELTLDFSIRKIINGKYFKHKYWGLNINMDVTNITYTWE